MNVIFKRCVLLSILGIGASLTGLAQATPQCETAAQQIAGAMACYQDAAPGSPLLRFDGAQCQATDAAYFEDQTTAKKFAGAGQVTTLPKTGVPACPVLYLVNPAPPAGALAASVPASPDVRSIPELNKVLREHDPVEVLKLSSGRSTARALNTSANPNAIGTGLPAVAAEVVQILGQIVVDRSTQAAYRMLAEKVQGGLQCVTSDGKPNPNTFFPATCAAVASIRIQDLAMAREVLLRALASDIARAALNRVKWPPGTKLDAKLIAAIEKELDHAGLDAESVKTAKVALHGELQAAAAALRALKKPLTSTEATSVVTSAEAASARTPQRVLEQSITLLLTTISDPTKKRAGVVAHAIAAELEALARAQAAAHVDERAAPVVLAGAALIACEARVAAGTLPNLAACDISKEVDGFTAASERAKVVGRSVARSVQLALTATSDNKPDSDQRIVAALAASFDATCFAVNPDADLGCPALLDVVAQDHPRVILPLSLARGMLEAALERDTNRMVTTAVRGIEAVILPTLAASKETKARKKAMRLLAGIVQYSATFQPAGDGASDTTQAARHEQRTKILESLTADMSDRTGRDGDWIFSLGGSLAFVNGARFGSGETVYNGPVSLSLGVGLQNVPESCPVGWHFELGVLDLAQYLSFQSEPADSDANPDTEERKVVVREPKVQDALSPSFKLGFQWGREVPVYLAGAVGFVPFYQFVRDDGTKTANGAWTAGVALGGYVPLLDVN
jgi:hypothetical protein